MKRESFTGTLVIGVALAIIALFNVYHFAFVHNTVNAVWSAISGIAGGILIGTATTRARLQPTTPTKKNAKT